MAYNTIGEAECRHDSAMSEQAYTIPENLLGAAWQEIDQVYQQKNLADDGEAIDLETFRADLHRMIEEVYARP